MYLRDQPNESVNAESSLSRELISKGVMLGVGVFVCAWYWLCWGGGS